MSYFYLSTYPGQLSTGRTASESSCCENNHLRAAGTFQSYCRNLQIERHQWYFQLGQTFCHTPSQSRLVCLGKCYEPVLCIPVQRWDHKHSRMRPALTAELHSFHSSSLPRSARVPAFMPSHAAHPSRLQIIQRNIPSTLTLL